MGTVKGVIRNSWTKFSYRLLHMDAPLLANQQNVHQLHTEGGCRLEDLPGGMNGRDELQES